MFVHRAACGWHFNSRIPIGSMVRTVDLPTFTIKKKTTIHETVNMPSSQGCESRDRKSQSKTVEFDASGEVTEDPRASTSGLAWGKWHTLPTPQKWLQKGNKKLRFQVVPTKGRLWCKLVPFQFKEISSEPTLDFHGDVDVSCPGEHLCVRSDRKFKKGGCIAPSFSTYPGSPMNHVN